MGTIRAALAAVLLIIVPNPACTQCTTCNQPQPSQIYYNSQVAIQPNQQARPAGYVNIQFQPPSSVSRNQQIYVWYGNPQPNQNQMNQALGTNPQAGVQPQYNPNTGYPNNQQPQQQQPVMYNNINRDQPQYVNQPQQFNPNPSISQQTNSQQQIGYNPAAGQQQQQQFPTTTQSPYTTTASTPFAQQQQTTTPYGSQYPITGTPVNQGALGVNTMGQTQPFYSPSTTTQQPFFSSTQAPFTQPSTTTSTPIYQIGQGTQQQQQMNGQFSPSSTYSPYAASGSTLGNQVLYDPSTGLVTANGMNTQYGRYTSPEPAGPQPLRDTPVVSNSGGAAIPLLAGISALVYLL